jgi:MFS family permease
MIASRPLRMRLSMLARVPTVRTRWDRGSPGVDELATPRDDIVAEQVAGPDRFTQAEGPFTSYERVLHRDDDGINETITYRLDVPWFGWLFAGPVRAALHHRRHGQPWWAPPERLDARGVHALGLLCASSLVFGYCAVVFSQTIAFAADEFGTSEGRQAVAGVVVRWGVLFTVVLAALADRAGRRKVLVAVAIAAPICTALCALAPNLATLTIGQAFTRPLALALGIIATIVAAEEMPAGSRAYAISLLGMAYALGSGLCIIALPLADLGERAWRLVYVVPLVLLIVSYDLARRLPESRRFAAPHPRHPPLPRRRFVLVAAIGFLLNILIAATTFYENRYLKDVRGYSAANISLYTLVTSTPGGIGVIVGGRLADVRGRRIVAAVALVAAAVGSILVFSTAGAAMWLSKLVLVSMIGAATLPALGVYESELFPTGGRGRANGWASAIAIAGSTVSLAIAGTLLDADWSYGSVVSVLAVGPLLLVVLVVVAFPETAHVPLEELNPEDRVGSPPRPATG